MYGGNRLETSADRDFEEFKLIIKSKTGIDLSLYKEAQMKRRLTTLREKRGFSDFVSYSRAILRDGVLLEEFLDRMTINVSEFFRNANRWEVIEKKVIPDLLQTKSQIKCWSAACSTGEEPYTIAMILSKFMRKGDVQLLATDLDDGVIHKAKLGIYPERSLREVPAEYMRHFKQNGSLFEVVPEIKSWVQYQKHNLLKDVYDKSFDWIICRNVMIYFTDTAKKEIYEKFSAALRPGGFLFVGSTEQIFYPEQFGLEVAETFIYRKK
jgi:chemotaxis protein methyltransferase CheR